MSAGRVVTVAAPPSSAPPSNRRPRQKATHQLALPQDETPRLLQEIRLLRKTLSTKDAEVRAQQNQIAALSREVSLLRGRNPEADMGLLVKFMDDKLESRQETIVELQASCKALEEKFAGDLEAVQQAYDLKMQELEQLLDDKQAVIEDLETQLDEMKDYKESKQFVMEEIKALRQRLVDTNVAHKAILDEYENKVKKDMQKMAHMYKSRVDNLEARARQLTLETLSEETRVILRENVRMASELSVHYEHSSRLTADLNAAQQKIKELELLLSLAKKRDAKRVELFPRVGEGHRGLTSSWKGEDGNHSATSVTQAQSAATTTVALTSPSQSSVTTTLTSLVVPKSQSQRDTSNPRAGPSESGVDASSVAPVQLPQIGSTKKKNSEETSTLTTQEIVRRALEDIDGVWARANNFLNDSAAFVDPSLLVKGFRQQKGSNGSSSVAPTNGTGSNSPPPKHSSNSGSGHGGDGGGGGGGGGDDDDEGGRGGRGGRGYVGGGSSRDPERRDTKPGVLDGGAAPPPRRSTSWSLSPLSSTAAALQPSVHVNNVPGKSTVPLKQQLPLPPPPPLFSRASETALEAMFD